jgi:hypothetical protein
MDRNIKEGQEVAKELEEAAGAITVSTFYDKF